jgi:hypothetical protein
VSTEPDTVRHPTAPHHRSCSPPRPLLEGVGGRYFDDCAESEVVDRRTGWLHGVARYAVDPDKARRLWDLSEELLGD